VVFCICLCLTEGEDAFAWLNDTGYGHLASKIEGLNVAYIYDGCFIIQNDLSV